MYVQGQCVGAVSSRLHSLSYTLAINDKSEGVHDPLWYMSTSFKEYQIKTQHLFCGMKMGVLRVPPLVTSSCFC